MLALCLVATLTFQRPARRSRRHSRRPLALETWTMPAPPRAARLEEEAARDKQATRQERTAAVEALARGKHESLVAAFADVVQQRSVAARAACGRDGTRIPADGGVPPRGPPAAGARRSGEGARACSACRRGLDRNGYESESDWPRLAALYERDWGLDQVPLKKAILELVGRPPRGPGARAPRVTAVGPAPENVNHPDDPPSRVPGSAGGRSGRCCLATVRRVLRIVSGQQFEDADAARMAREAPRRATWMTGQPEAGASRPGSAAPRRRRTARRRPRTPRRRRSRPRAARRRARPGGTAARRTRTCAGDVRCARSYAGSTCGRCRVRTPLVHHHVVTDALDGVVIGIGEGLVEVHFSSSIRPPGTSAPARGAARRGWSRRRSS